MQHHSVIYIYYLFCLSSMLHFWCGLLVYIAASTAFALHCQRFPIFRHSHGDWKITTTTTTITATAKNNQVFNQQTNNQQKKEKENWLAWLCACVIVRVYFWVVILCSVVRVHLCGSLFIRVTLQLIVHRCSA